MCRHGTAAWSLVALALLFAPHGTLAQDATRLERDAPIERDLAAGQVHHYVIALEAGRFAFVAVEQRGIDVILHVTGPDGEDLYEVDSPNGRQGIEPVMLFTEAAGDYHIEVQPLNEDADPGRYEVRVERLEPVAATREGRVDQLFAVWDRPGSPGASIGIMQDGEMVYANGYGEAQLEYHVPITPETVFHVASVSKQFTAFAVTLLADRGMLSLDDDIRQYLPELHDFGPTITIRHLIHHVSGLRDQWDLLALAGWRLDDVITREQILRLVARQRELNFPPGDTYLYCNTGYTLLAEIVSRVTEMPFPQFMREEVFEPLGMAHTHFHDDHEMVVPNRAYSYGADPDGGYRKRVLSYANVGATSLFTTVGDVLRWTRNLDEGSVGGRGVLEMMHRRGVLNSGDTLGYAAGLGIGRHRGLSLVGHAGGDAGFRTYVGRFPDQGVAVAVFSNAASFNASQMALRAADLYLEEHIRDIPETPVVATGEPARADVDPAVFDAYEGSYAFPSGLLVEVRREGDRLVGQVAGQPPAELIPRSETEFFVPAASATITFERERGEVTSLVSVQGDVVQTARRIPPFDPTTVALEDYVGRYYSAELETSYVVVVVEGRLQAIHVRHDPIDIFDPVGPDRFESEFGQIQFERDGTGTVTRMLVSSGRVRNLRFERVVW
jgi:CubicO group peptidase (beta-lactamase class C family)